MAVFPVPKLTPQHERGRSLGTLRLPGTSPALERTEGDWGNVLWVTALVPR